MSRVRLLATSLLAALLVVASAAAAASVGPGGASGESALAGPSARTPIYGTDRPDVLRGTLGDDLICGLGGNDRIDGLTGNDLIFGGAGNDHVVGGAGRDQVRGGPGNDVVFGRGGPDNLDGERDNDTLVGEAGNDGLVGRDGNDRLNGGIGDDKLGGRAGNDILRGGSGKDFLSGGGGGDRSFGEAGNDVLHGGPGRDRLSGGVGNDKLEAGGGALNVLLGQQGTDVFEARNGLRDLLNGGPGRDRARVDGVLDVVQKIEAIERDTTALGTGNARSSVYKPLGENQAAVCRAPAGNPSRPVAVPTNAATPEDTPVSLGLTGESPFLTTFSFELTQPQRGSTAITGPASCRAAATPSGWSCSVTTRYSPNTDFFGADGFSFTVDSREGISAPGAVTLAVSEVNDPPVTGPDAVAGPENASLGVPVKDVLANDRPGPANESAQNLVVQSVKPTADSHGSATLAGETITYSPDRGYFGPATIVYTACDDGTTAGRPDPRCSDGTISITITDVANERPTATEQQVTTAEDSTLSIGLSGADANGDPLTFAVAGVPAHGTLTGTAPNLTYKPDPDFYGADSLTFTTSDGLETSAPATVAITVTEVNDEPAVTDDEFSVGVSESTVIPAALVLWNDSEGPPNEAGQALEVRAVATTPANGVVSLVDQQIVYTPAPGFSGTATVGYTACDEGTTDGQPDPLCDDQGSITLFVIRANRAPIADPQQFVTAEDTSRTVTLTATDPDGDPVTFRIVEGPEHGSLQGTGPALIYRPAQDYYGPDRFTFVARDGRNESESATVAINVTEVNDPPVLGLDTVTLGGMGALPPLPPRPFCPAPCGAVYGDPHVHTYDNGHYMFQAVGEFIVAKSTTDDFEVQVRTKGVEGSREVSLPYAVALRAGAHEISMHRTLTGYDTYVDGVLTDVPAFPRTLSGGVTMGTYGSEHEVFFVWPDDTTVIVSAVGLFGWSYRFTIQVGPAPGRLGQMVGLLGDADDERSNDLVTRGGQEIFFPPYPEDPDFDDLYGIFGHSWRISQAESLFRYGAGETTDTFTDLTFPDRPVTPDDLPAGVRANATAQCGLFGVTDPALLKSCIVDVGVTGDVEFATSSAAAQEAVLGIPDNTGVTSIGATTTVAVDTAGTRAVRAFTGLPGQKVTLSVSDNTIPHVDVTLRRPDGSQLTSLTLVGATGFHDTITLPAEGTYTVTVDPRDDHTGSLTFSLDPVPENTGAATIGMPTTVMIGTVGENAVRTFTADAGQMVTLSASGNTIPHVDLVVRRPDGSHLTSLTLDGATGFHDTITLAVAGTYTITVDPRQRHLGMLTFSLDAVPANTGATTIGTATHVTIGTVGENAVRSFTATAGSDGDALGERQHDPARRPGRPASGRQPPHEPDPRRRDRLPRHVHALRCRDVHDHRRSAAEAHRGADLHARRRSGEHRRDDDRHGDARDDRDGRRERGSHVRGERRAEGHAFGGGEHDPVRRSDRAEAGQHAPHELGRLDGDRVPRRDHAARRRDVHPDRRPARPAHGLADLHDRRRPGELR